MKRKNRIYLRMTILIIVYFVLLTILCVSESADSSAKIRSFKDALWYSLVTFTTSGYGDLTPVTPVGQAVGVVFLLLSAGIIMTLFGAVISFVTSEGLPLFLLGLQRKKNWYYSLLGMADAPTHRRQSFFELKLPHFQYSMV